MGRRTGGGNFPAATILYRVDLDTRSLRATSLTSRSLIVCISRLRGTPGPQHSYERLWIVPLHAAELVLRERDLYRVRRFLTESCLLLRTPFGDLPFPLGIVGLEGRQDTYPRRRVDVSVPLD